MRAIELVLSFIAIKTIRRKKAATRQGSPGNNARCPIGKLDDYEKLAVLGERENVPKSWG